jgi:hypothetical protein
MGENVQISDKQQISCTERDRQAVNRSVESWSNGLFNSQKAQSKQNNDEGFLDFDLQDPLLIAQAKLEARKPAAKKSAPEAIGSWTKTHPLHGSNKEFSNRDDAAVAAFKENRLEERSQLVDKEYGFWVYPTFSKSGSIKCWAYTEPFESTSKKDTVITQQDWMNHSFPASADKIPGAVAQGHAHPHKRPPGETRPGYETFSAQDLQKINNPNPKYSLPSFLENADYEVRRRLPGEKKDTVVGSDKHK